MNKQIIKYNGEKANRKDCKRIKNNFYEMNKDCFFINEKWYRIDSGLIEYDHENKKYDLKSKLTKGIVDFKENNLLEGYFTPNIYENVSSNSNGNLNNSLEINNFILSNVLSKEMYSSSALRSISQLVANAYTGNNYDYSSSGFIQTFKNRANYSSSIIQTGRNIPKLYDFLAYLLANNRIESFSDGGTEYALNLIQEFKSQYTPVQNDYQESFAHLNSRIAAYLIYNNNPIVLIKIARSILIASLMFVNETIENEALKSQNLKKIDPLLALLSTGYIADKYSLINLFSVILEESELNSLNSVEEFKDLILYISDTGFLDNEAYTISSERDLVRVEKLFLNDIYLDKLFFNDKVSLRLNGGELINLISICGILIEQTMNPSLFHGSMIESDKKAIFEYENQYSSIILNLFLDNKSLSNYSGSSFWHNNIEKIKSRLQMKNNLIKESCLENSSMRSIKDLFYTNFNELFFSNYLFRRNIDFLPLIQSSSESFLFLNEEVANKCGYYQVQNSEFVSNSPGNSKSFKDAYNSLSYNIGENSFIEKEISEFFAKYIANKTEDDTLINKLFKGYSFGVEYETSYGYIPKRHLYKTGMIPLKDGSLNGGIEYTTLPISPSEGNHLLKMQTDVLSKYCEINSDCSLHVHIGNVPRTKEFGLSLYMLFRLLQDELFEFIPPYKKDLEWMSSRGKDYCKPLKSLQMYNYDFVNYDGSINQESINLGFSKLFQFLTEGVEESESFNFENGIHPKQGSGKWNWKSRYYAINLLNLYFSKYKTVEFRLHTPTTNYQKTLSWVIICMAIVEYAKNNMKKIFLGKEKICLKDVVDSYIESFSEDEIENNKYLKDLKSYLHKYIDARKNEFERFVILQNVSATRDEEISKDNHLFISTKTVFDNIFYKKKESKNDLKSKFMTIDFPSMPDTQAFVIEPREELPAQDDIVVRSRPMPF